MAELALFLFIPTGCCLVYETSRALDRDTSEWELKPTWLDFFLVLEITIFAVVTLVYIISVVDYDTAWMLRGLLVAVLLYLGKILVRTVKQILDVE